MMNVLMIGLRIRVHSCGLSSSLNMDCPGRFSGLLLGNYYTICSDATVT